MDNLAVDMTAPETTTGLQFSRVPPAAIWGLRDTIEEHLRKAMSHDVSVIEEPADVLVQVFHGRSQLWMAHEGNDILGIITTVVLQHPRQRTLRIVYLAGRDFKRWAKPAAAELEEYARQKDCAGIDGGSPRRGWGVALRELGFTAVATLYRKELGK